MVREKMVLTGREIFLGKEEIIVSKTDLKGCITYGNDAFIRMSGFEESEFLGAPHNIVRHPDMPACVFRLLWETIASGKEIFAYVLNLCKNGDQYWVLAHVTPTLDDRGNIIGYHSNRRAPDQEAISAIKPIYNQLVKEERAHRSRREGSEAALLTLRQLLEQNQMTYDEFIWSLSRHEPSQFSMERQPCLLS